MGMARSKINRDREKINNQINNLEKLEFDPRLIKANLTIKRLKHSLSVKDKEIEELYSLIKIYENLICSSKDHQDYADFILNFNKDKRNKIRKKIGLD